ncbi:MAG TPA: epoxyqueuosine reductase [Methanospirillum sp.]|nr:epoxyqueuosine reductase [Methanospirillum sp.]
MPTNTSQITNPPQWISDLITNFLQNSSENFLNPLTQERIWGTPLVGFCRGDDPLFQEFQDHLGDDYLLPLDIMLQTMPDVKIRSSDLTVISWILPVTNQTKADHRLERQYPTEAWARTRISGEGVNQQIRQYIVQSLQQAGYPSESPLHSPAYTVKFKQGYPTHSLWSERHAAYACGLGTFGLCDGLITPIGKAMRCGSVITTLPVPASGREYGTRHEYCPFLTDQSCGICIERCPAGAISQSGHDKVKCAAYFKTITEPYLLQTYGIEGNACGLCQTGVPCESGIPKRR